MTIWRFTLFHEVLSSHLTMLIKIRGILEICPKHEMSMQSEAVIRAN